MLVWVCERGGSYGLLRVAYGDPWMAMGKDGLGSACGGQVSKVLGFAEAFA